MAKLFDHKDKVWSIAVARLPDGTTVALSGGGSKQRRDGTGFEPGDRDYTIRLWELPQGKLLRQFSGHDGDVLALAFCPNGRHFLSASSDKTIRLWDLASGKQLRLLGRHTRTARTVAPSPDGKSAVSGGQDCKVRFWRLPATLADLVRALDGEDAGFLLGCLKDMDCMGSEALPSLWETGRCLETARPGSPSPVTERSATAHAADQGGSPGPRRIAWQ